ncbi:hypothetical protein [Streptomyces sp. NPDC001068]|uniref:hypothetical protein n=1 Tax=Streptomyces sp. NPDC001068 TaxID=3364544 RepID=UPI0036826AE2
MKASTHGDYLRVLGPTAPLARVFAFFESDGYSDPAAAWLAFTRTWNWAAPLTTAVPGTGFPGPVAVACPASGGFAVSGQWRLPSLHGTGTWLALPLAGPADGGPDLFVVSSQVLPCAVRALPAACDGRGPGFRLENAHVPGGLVTRAAGEALRAEDAVFFWTAVTALALGAARRVVDVLADPSSDGVTPRPAAAAELAAVLHDERLSLAAVLHGAPSVRQGLPPAVEERLGDRVGTVGTTVRHVIAMACDLALTSDCEGGHPSLRVMEASSPILQQVRFAREILPRDDRTSRGKD